MWSPVIGADCSKYLFVLKLGFPLFHERLHAVLGIASLVAERREIRLHAQPVVEGHIVSTLDGFAGELQGSETVAAELARIRFGGGEARWLDDAVDEPDRQRFLGADFSPGPHEFEGAALALTVQVYSACEIRHDARMAAMSAPMR